MTRSVFVTSTPESALVNSAGSMNACEFLKGAITRDTTSQVKLVDSSEHAQLIIFAESHKDPAARESHASVRVRSHPIYKAHTNKCVIHHGADRPIPIIPGLYPSIPKQWASRLGCVGAPYLSEHNPFLDQLDSFDSIPTKLASFMGSCARKPLRLELCELASSPTWNDIDAIDSTNDYIGTLRSHDLAAHNDLKRSFIEGIMRSKFCLCPRGAGSSSYRIFESMQCARVPVIIADDWSPPPGPDWDAFAIRIGQSDITSIPDLLKEREHDWESLGRLARNAWETHYHPDVFGSQIVELAFQVLEQHPGHRLSRKVASRVFVMGPANIARLRAKIDRKRFG